MRIGIDIDGVCYQWSKTARYMLREILPNSPYGMDGPMGQESTSWDYIKENISKKHHAWLWKEGVANGLFRHGDLFPGTVKALKKLAELGRLIAVTQRPHRAAQDTFDWISYHRLPFEEVHVLQGGSKTATGTYDAFIDDKPQNCCELASVGTPVVCMPDRPWNRGCDDVLNENGVLRIRSWNDFIFIIRDELTNESVS